MMFQWTAAIAFGSATLIPIAHAGPCLNVGVHFTTSNRTGPDNVITDLMDTGSFESIEFIDASHFRADNDNDALFIAWGKSPDAVNEPNRVLYGERLADYISTGGSVVITQRGISENIGPGADFRNEFLPLLAESACPYGIEGTSPITFPGEDPIFSEVHILNVGFYSEVSCNGGTIREGAQLHASLPDGRPFVVSDGPVVAINSYFVSDDSVAPDSIYGYPAGSDYPQLFANALYFAAGFDASTACNGDYDDDGLSDEDEATLGPDFQRADSDADGTNDGIDNCPSLANPDQRDFDNDGIGDACSDNPPPDSDEDGHPDPYDNCPTTHNPDQADADSDGTGDACEPEPEPEPQQDTDEDGITDDLDNCPTVFNPAQDDEDDDGIGDICDDDTTIGCASTTPGPAWTLLFLCVPILSGRRRR
jgi:hypothetical protein